MSITKLKFGRAGEQVFVEGQAPPGSEIKAENLSAAPFAPDRAGDAFTTARAGADGRFRLAVPAAREGDQLKLRSLGSAGVALVNVRVKDLAALDGRRAEVSLQALRLVADGSGQYRFGNVSRHPRLSEPGATLQLTNQRTQEKASFVLDAQGLMQADARLPGLPGDVFTVAASDGAHNLDFGETWGYLVAPPEAGVDAVYQPPADLKANRRTMGMLRVHTFTGPLVVDSIDADDPIQGNVGDCYFVAGASAIAAVDPQAIQKLFKENADGTVTVTFKAYDPDAQAYVDRPITVSRELYTGLGGGPEFGGSRNSGRLEKAELWFPLLEKAYAAWKGGYDGLSNGFPYEVFEAVLGVEGRHFDTEAMSAEAIFQQLKRASKDGEPVITWTKVDSPERPFINSDLAADHAYAVLGVEESNGERRVKLRNPWGRFPDDGNLTVPLEKFIKYFAAMGIAR